MNKIEKLYQADFKKRNLQHLDQISLSAFVGVHKVVQANDKSECEQVNKIETLLILWLGRIGDQSFQGAVEEILRSTDRN